MYMSVIRNSIFAAGITLLMGLYFLDPTTAQFGDLVRIVQSPKCQSLTAILALVFCALDLMWAGFGYTKRIARNSDGSAAGRSNAA